LSSVDASGLQALGNLATKLVVLVNNHLNVILKLKIIKMRDLLTYILME
jgi:hypothetical protein